MALSVLAQGSNQGPITAKYEPPLAVLADSVSSVQKISLKENEYLFKEDDLPQGLYLLKSGSIMTGVQQKQSRGRAAGSAYINKLIGPGEFFGYKALISEGKSQFFAKAVKASEVLVYPKDSFDAILNGPNTLLKLVLLQTVRDLENYEAISQLHYLASVEERIAYQLILLGDKFGVETPEGIRLNLKLTRNELAQLAGTINESLSRHLTSFKNEGILDVRGKEIIIRDRAALARKSGNF